MARTSKPWRCNYCKAPATVWVRYIGHISRDIRPRTGGAIVCWMASCDEHEECVNWTSMLAIISEREHAVERAHR